MDTIAGRPPASSDEEIDETDASDLKEIGVGEFLANLLSSDDTDDFFEDEPMPMGGEADPRDERDVLSNSGIKNDGKRCPDGSL